MEKKTRKNNGIKFYVVISLVLVLGVVGLVRAYNGLTAPKVVVEGNYIESQQPVAEGETLGAFPGNEVYGDMFFYNQLLGGFAVDQIFAIPATTTLNVVANGRDLTDVVASYTNTTGKKLECDLTRFALLTSSDTFTFSYGVGTTTLIASSPSWTNTTTATIIASTTAANTLDVTANGFGYFTNEGNWGSNYTVNDNRTPSTTAFVLDNQTSIVAWVHTIDATSSLSFTRKDGNKITGALQSSCHFFNY
jgi:hypothetical protein